MLYLLIGVLASICIALYISIIRTRAKNKLQILMLLLAHEENGCDGYMEISHTKDPRAARRLLHTMVKEGHLDQRIMVDVTAPRRMHVRELYRLTPGGSKFAKQIKANFLRRRNR